MLRSCPAVIVGANEMGLAAARSLAIRGIRVFAIHLGTARPPPAYSRYLSFTNGPSIEHQDAAIDFLIEYATRFSVAPVLLPAQDQVVLLMYRYRERLAHAYRFYFWDSNLLPRVGSKTEFASVAKAHDLPVPRTLVVDDRCDLERRIAGLKFPLLVKPEFNTAWWGPDARRLGLNHKAIEVTGADALLDIFDRNAQIRSKIVTQQLVVGPDSAHYDYAAFVSPDGEIRAEIVVHKPRISPTRFGVGSYVRTVVDPQIRDAGRAALQRLGYRGFASINFKRDSNDGRRYLLEINLRWPIWIELAIAAGVDFPYYHYCSCLGQAFDVPQQYQLDKRWMAVSKDFRSVRRYVSEGQSAWSQWIMQLLRQPTFPLFRWDDPLPALMDLVRHVRSSFARSRIPS